MNDTVNDDSDRYENKRGIIGFIMKIKNKKNIFMFSVGFFLYLKLVVQNQANGSIRFSCFFLS